MNLFLTAGDVIGALSSQLVASLKLLVIRINEWAKQEHHADGTHAAISVTGFTFNGTTQTTVGAAGGATALPATPTGYTVITIGTTNYVVPYYAES